MFAGAELKDECDIADCDIKQNSTLNLLLNEVGPITNAHDASSTDVIWIPSEETGVIGDEPHNNNYICSSICAYASSMGLVFGGGLVGALCTCGLKVWTHSDYSPEKGAILGATVTAVGAFMQAFCKGKRHLDEPQSHLVERPAPADEGTW